VTRPRGNRNSDAEMAKRRAAVASDLVATGTLGNKEEYADLIGVSRTTLWRDLQALEVSFVEGSADDVKAFKQAQYRALMLIEQAIANGAVPPEVGNALTRVRDSVARLLGLNAPERRITAHVDASNTQVQYRFLEHAHGLTAEQVEETFRFMDSLPRKKVSIADCYPGQTGKPVPQLTEGESTND
jgi:hypothetical protein